MNTTGAQIAKAAIPAVVLTGTGFFGSLIAGTIIVLGIAASGLLLGVVAVDIIDSRRTRKLRGKPETA